MTTNGEGVLVDELPGPVLGTVTVPRVRVKLAVLIEREVSGDSAEAGIEMTGVGEAIGATPELKVSMTV